MLTLRTLLCAIFVGGGRPATPRGGEGTRDGENIVRLVRTYPTYRPQILESLMIIITGGREKSMVEVDSFPCHMSSLYGSNYRLIPSPRSRVQQG